MIQTPPILSILRSATAAARIAMLAAGLSAASVAHAGNCTDAPISGHSYYIVNKDSGLQLDVAYGSKNIGADVVQWNAGTSTNQRWTLADTGRGTWSMRAVHSQQALDLYDANPAENAPVKQYTYFGWSSNQQWLLNNNNSDAYTIASNSSYKFLTVADKTAGAVLKQHSAQPGYALQRWYFNPVDDKCNASVNPAFGSFMGSTRILIGGMVDGGEADKNPQAAWWQAPWDLTYGYMHSPTAPKGSCYTTCDDFCNKNPDGGWWACWQASQWDRTPGTSIAWKNGFNAKHTYQGRSSPVMQQWTWYSMQDVAKAQGKLNKDWGISNGDRDDFGALKNQWLMQGYFDDYRFFLQKIGTTNRNIIQLEPDFWGLVRPKDGSNNPHFVPAVVQEANKRDCPNEENSAAGFASCLIKMARDYAPKSTVGLHVSCWDWNKPDSATEGPKACAKYHSDLGAGKGDFVVSDAADRDAAWKVKNDPTWGYLYWWDDAAFTKFVNTIQMMTETVQKPMIIWQIPLGNKNMPNPGKIYQWQDNKVDYMFNNLDRLAKAHVVALQFGAGHDEQTSVETDGGYFLQKAQAYFNSGGQALK